MIQISKTEVTSFYSQLNLLRVRLNSVNLVPITFQDIIFPIYISMTSFSLPITITSLPPATDITITFTITLPSAIGLLFLGTAGSTSKLNILLSYFSKVSFF